MSETVAFLIGLMTGLVLGLILIIIVWEYYMKVLLATVLKDSLQPFVDKAALEVMKECSCGGDCKCEDKK